MILRFGALCALVLGLVSGDSTWAAAQLEPKVSGYIPVNGIKMYYEIYGKEDGIPLVLLHGGASTIESTFGKVIPVLAANHRLIAIEEQAHGRTTDRDQALRFETSAEDVVALLKSLKVERFDLFGFSNGASIAMLVAIKNPEKVRKLVYASSMTKRSGAQPQIWDFIRKSDFSQMPQQLKDAFLKVNTDSVKLKVMHRKTRDRMINFKDIDDKDVRTIAAETLILMGDRDVGRLEHGIELSRMIPKSRLMILPYGHGDYMGEASSTRKESSVPQLTMGLIEEFLEAN